MTSGEEHPRSILGSDSVDEHPASGSSGRRGAKPVVRLDPGDDSRQHRPQSLFGPPPSAFDADPRRPPPRSPFLDTTGQLPIITAQTPIERFVEALYRWRSVLGLTMVTTMTVAIVIVAVYRSPSGEGSELTSVAAGSATTDPRSAIEAVTDFEQDPAAAAAGPSTTDTGETQVGSEVDDSTSASRDATAAATPQEPASSSGGSANGDGGEETTASSSSTTVPEATTTVPGSEVDSSSSSTSSSSTSTTADDSTSSTETTETSAPPAEPLRLEAEDGQVLAPASVKAVHANFSGSGYVTDVILEGGGVTVTVDDHPGGSVPLRIRYAAGDTIPLEGVRSLSLVVNDVVIGQLSMGQSGTTWSEWFTLDAGPVELAAGTNTISLIWAAGDTGWVNIDYLELGSSGE